MRFLLRFESASAIGIDYARVVMGTQRMIRLVAKLAQWAKGMS